jgi:multidrug efflux pump subunit AcrA (membrane-fusion protein)
VDVAPGEDAGKASPVTLIDTGRVQVTVTVDEVDVTRVRVGQPSEVLIDALGAPALRGTVVRIAPIAEQGSQVTSYEVQIEIAPGDRPVRPGMTASATIIADQRERALSIPAAAVRRDGAASVVTVVSAGADGQSRVEARQVQVGATFGDRVEVLGGLREGELVQVGDAK